MIINIIRRHFSTKLWERKFRKLTQIKNLYWSDSIYLIMK